MISLISCHAGQQREVRHGPCVTRGSHSFTCHPHTDHIVCTPQSHCSAKSPPPKKYRPFQTWNTNLRIQVTQRVLRRHVHDYLDKNRRVGRWCYLWAADGDVLWKQNILRWKCFLFTSSLVTVKQSWWLYSVCLLDLTEASPTGKHLAFYLLNYLITVCRRVCLSASSKREKHDST